MRAVFRIHPAPQTVLSNAFAFATKRPIAEVFEQSRPSPCGAESARREHVPQMRADFFFARGSSVEDVTIVCRRGLHFLSEIGY